MKSFVLGGFATLNAVGIGVLGMGAISMPVIAQSTPGTEQTTPQQTNGVLRTALEQEGTLYLNKDKTYDYDLVLRAASVIGNQRLPVGTIVRGRFEPAEGGLIYTASSVEIADRILPIRAASELLRDRKDPRQTSTGAVLTDAAIGAAGGYILADVFGKPNLWKVAGGAAAGVLVGNTTAPFVVILKPEDSIMLFAN